MYQPWHGAYVFAVEALRHSQDSSCVSAGVGHLSFVILLCMFLNTPNVPII